MLEGLESALETTEAVGFSTAGVGSSGMCFGSVLDVKDFWTGRCSDSVS